MKNINVCFLAAVACTYSIQASANSLNNNLNFVLENNVYSLHSSSAASHTVTPLELKPILNSNSGVKLAAVCALGAGGCDDMNFNLDNAAQCRDEGFGTNCPSGYVPDANNKCPYNNSFFKCRVCSHTCNSGSLTTCNSEQVETGSSRNDCSETCYTCRAKTCEEGGYASSINSCQKASTVGYAGKTCYTSIAGKTCTDGGYVAAIPSNNTCSSTSYCGNTCYHSCSQPTCSVGGFKDAIPTNNACTATTYYGRTCYKDCYQPNCGAGGYNASIPANNLCSSVNYYGATCYKDCYQPACSAGGYEASIPSGKTCDAVSYYGRSCYSNCRVVELTPQQKCANEGFIELSCAKYMSVTNCGYDNKYKKCTATCGSKIYENNPTYTVDEGNYSGVTVITKNATYLPSGKTIYSNVNFPQYPECAALPKPVITMDTYGNSNSEYSQRVSGDRIENIDFVFNVTKYISPSYCNKLYNYVYSKATFCSDSCSSYECCINNCRSNKCNSYDCEDYKSLIKEMGEWNDPCSYKSDGYGEPYSYNVLCNNQQLTGVSLGGNSGSGTLILKNVNMKVNGDVAYGFGWGMGAWVDNKGVTFEGNCILSGGTRYTIGYTGERRSASAHGTGKATLTVSSGATLSTNKGICANTGSRAILNRYGTISGTVATGCNYAPSNPS